MVGWLFPAYFVFYGFVNVFLTALFNYLFVKKSAHNQLNIGYMQIVVIKISIKELFQSFLSIHIFN